MNRHTNDQMKGAAMGLAIGAAMGGVGSYVAQQNPKEVKRAVKKVTHSAEKAMHNLDKMRKSK